MRSGQNEAIDAGEAAGARLRRLMRTRCVAIPGAFNGLVARAVADAGFDACYVSGGAISAASGVPDIGLLSLEAFCRVIREVADSSGLPVIADADTGFGEGEMLTRTVWDYHRAGAAGFHIEDQVFPKRCGHLDGKSLVGIDNMQEKISRAAAARDACSGGSFIVCARTDARSVEGLESAIERSLAYIDAGADMLFPEGFHSEDELGRFAESVRGRGRDGGPFLLGNMTEFGKTPIIPMERWESLGYSCVIFPVSTLRAAMGAVTQLLAGLRRDGHVEAAIESMQSRKDLYRLLGYTPGTEWVFPGPSRKG